MTPVPISTTPSQYTVLSWNVLAQSYARKRTYPYCTPHTLTWSHRRLLIHNLLQQYNNDILCLQEIDYYNDYYKLMLDQLGYNSIYINRTDASHHHLSDTVQHNQSIQPHMHSNNKNTKQKYKSIPGGELKHDGCVVAYKRDKFIHSVTDVCVVDYNNLSLVHDNPTHQSQYYRSNVGMIVRLRCVGVQPIHQDILVCNTHVYWNPAHSHVKLHQCIYFTQCIEQYCQQHKCQPYIIMCGDFNSTPSSDVYEYLTTGYIDRIADALPVNDTGYDGSSIQNIRLLVDVDMNKICRWLRAIGLDTEWFGKYNVVNNKIVSGVRNAGQSQPFNDLLPDTMFNYARSSNRIIITRSRSLIQRSACPRYIFIESSRSAVDAFEDIVKYLNVQFDSNKFYSRCTVCNGEFIAIDRDELLCAAPDDLPQPIIDRHGHDFNGKLLDFWRCVNNECNQLYWWSNKSQQSKDKFESWLSDKCVNNNNNNHNADSKNIIDRIGSTNYPTISSSKKFAYIRDRFENIDFNDATDSTNDTDNDGCGHTDTNLLNTTIDQKSIAYQLIHCAPNTKHTHKLNLQSVYSQYTNNSTEPQFTNYTATFAETLDYILIDKRISIINTVPLLSQSYCNIQTALPNTQFPSDHLILSTCIQLPVTDKPVQLQQQLYKPDDPSIDHIYRPPYVGEVYEPNHDTWLMMDALVKDQQFLYNLLQYNQFNTCIEIGTGTGILLSYLYKILQHHHIDAQYIGTDRNLLACHSALQTFQLNHISADIIHTDLIQPIQHKLQNNVNVILFNPPYLPTDDPSLLQYDNIDAAYAGGINGREVTDRVLSIIPHIMNVNSIIYMVLVPANLPQQIAEIMWRYGFTAENIIEKQCQNELLQIWKYYKCSGNYSL